MLLGEANAVSPDTYNCTFPAMIDDWRHKWALATDKQTDEKFFFGFVQVILYVDGVSNISNGY